MRYAMLVMILLFAQSAQAQINVSPNITFTIGKQVNVPPRHYQAIPIANAQPGDQFDISLNIRNAVYRDISAFVTDETDLNLFHQGLPFKRIGPGKRNAPIHFSAKAWSYGTYYLVLNNQYANFITKKAQFQAQIHTRMPTKVQAGLRQALTKEYNQLKSEFVFPDFDINVRPCGQSNAFSNPNITICSELLLQMARKKAGGALEAIFLHELGHTLLNLWGMPGYDNEDVADEFSAVLTLQRPGGEKALDQELEWFSSQSSVAEANNMLARGDRHALSIQRIRNIQRIIHNPKPVIHRWNRFLYPHMTKRALESIVKKPGPYGQPQLAQHVLKMRAHASNNGQSPHSEPSSTS